MMADAPFDDDGKSEWQRKGGTLTDHTARKEFGLTQEELVQAFKAGEVQAHRTWIHGNPCMRLLRREVEALARRLRGDDYLKGLQAGKDLVQVNRDLKRLRKQSATLEGRKARLLAGIEK